MDTKKLVPYSVYLPLEMHVKLKKAAKQRKASQLIRDAITMNQHVVAQERMLEILGGLALGAESPFPFV